MQSVKHGVIRTWRQEAGLWTIRELDGKGTQSNDHVTALFVTSAKDDNSVFPVFHRIADDLAASEDANEIRLTCAH